MRSVPGDRSQAGTRHGRGGGKGLAVTLAGWLGFKAPRCHGAARGCYPRQGNYVLLNITMLFRLHRPLLRPVCRRKCHVPQQLPGLVSAGIAQTQILPPPAGPVLPVVTTPAHHRCCRATNGVPRPTGHQSVHKFQLPLTAFLKQRLRASPTRVPLLGTKSPLPPQGLPGHPLSPSPHRCHHIPRLQPRSAPWMPHPKSSTEPNLCLKPMHPPWVCSAPGRSSLNLGAGAAAWLQHHPVPTQSTAPVPHGAKSLGHDPPPPDTPRL